MKKYDFAISFFLVSENMAQPEFLESVEEPRPRSQSLGTGVASLNINSINSLGLSNSCILGSVAGNQNSLLLLCFLNSFPPTD